MPGSLEVGQLVEVIGSPGPIDIPEEWRKPGTTYAGAKDFNGAKGQTVKWCEDRGHWMVATFDALMVPVKEQNLKPLSFKDVEEYDIALGPRSDPEVMGEEIASAIVDKSIAVCKLFLSPDDMASMVATADKAIGDGSFVRLPMELEPGYLGKDGTGKTMDLDMEDEDVEGYIKESPLTIIEDTFSTVGVLLRPYTGDKLGHDIHSRSNTMLCLPFNGDEDSFPPPDFENDEAAHFLQTMYRSKLMALVNVGPGSGVLSLTSSSQGETAKLDLNPGTMVVMDAKCKYSYAPSGKSLTMRCWYLDYPQTFEITQHPDADLTQLIEFNERGGTTAPTRGDSIAVCAMGTRYAFGGWDPSSHWSNMRHAGVDTFIRMPITRWDCDIYYDEKADQSSGLSYTDHGGFSDGIDLFDNKFFDMSPAESRSIDPTQRQMLEVSYISLSGAGFNKKELMGKSQQIAVFAGIDKNEWQTMAKDEGIQAAGAANAITSNRFSYIFNLKGASMTIDTACSASLVCTHTAKLYLLHKAVDPCVAAVTCGINMLLSPFSFISCCGSGMLSHKGRSFTYNSTADGYARGESTGSHCIKNEAWDKEKGHIAMIAGSQVNQDGRSASLTAPNGPAQERCTSTALKEAGLTSSEVDCTETHGTGTSLGDPIELGAYQKVVAKDPRTEPVFVTTSKSNIGHCEGSAGISGFLKCVMMCLHAECCPGNHIRALNPHIDMTGFPGALVTEGALFRFDTSISGVLSFGFGGTNACAQVWGTNLMTTRAAGSKDAFKTILSKIQHAPPQEVTINGEDWENWEMDGPGKDVEPGQSWDICILSDGTVQYVEREADVKDFGTFYYITGTFNNWGRDPMEQDDMLDGMYSFVVKVGAHGLEEFQILADEDSEMTFFPATPHCHWKSAEVKGPSPATQDKSWCITGYPGQMMRVEFARLENNKVSVMWFEE